MHKSSAYYHSVAVYIYFWTKCFTKTKRLNYKCQASRSYTSSTVTDYCNIPCLAPSRCICGKTHTNTYTHTHTHTYTHTTSRACCCLVAYASCPISGCVKQININDPPPHSVIPTHWRRKTYEEYEDRQCKNNKKLKKTFGTRLVSFPWSRSSLRGRDGLESRWAHCWAEAWTSITQRHGWLWECSLRKLTCLKWTVSFKTSRQACVSLIWWDVLLPAGWVCLHSRPVSSYFISISAGI